MTSLFREGTFGHREVAEASSISRMIEGEERALDVAMVVFSSTRQETNDQWALYDGYANDCDPSPL